MGGSEEEASGSAGQAQPSMEITRLQFAREGAGMSRCEAGNSDRDGPLVGSGDQWEDPALGLSRKDQRGVGKLDSALLC